MYKIKWKWIFINENFLILELKYLFYIYFNDIYLDILFDFMT